MRYMISPWSGPMQGWCFLAVIGLTFAASGAAPTPAPVSLLHKGGEPMTLAYSADGALVAAGFIDGKVRAWYARSGRLIRALRAHDAEADFVCFVPGRKLLTASDRDSTVRLWNIAAGKCVSKIKTDGVVVAAALSPDAKTLATSCNNTVQLFDLATGKESGRLAVKSGEVVGASRLAFSPDGKLLAVATGTASRIVLWDTVKWRVVGTCKGHTGLVCGMSFNPTGIALVTAATDGSVRLWRVKDCRETARWAAPGERGFSAAVFVDNGSVVLAANAIGMLRAWDTATGKPVLKLHAHRALIWSATVSPKGDAVATACEDGTVRIWQRDSLFRPKRTK